MAPCLGFDVSVAATPVQFERGTAQDTVFSLTENRIGEGASDSTIVGTIKLADEIGQQTSRLWLVDNAGDRFGVYRDSLLIVRRGDLLDYETKRIHQVVIGALTGEEDTLRQAVSVYVLDKNDPPRIESLSENRVAENKQDTSFVGTFTVSDQDSSDRVNLRLIENAGGRFMLDGNNLMLTDTARFNYEEQKHHDIIAEAQDRLGETHKRSFRIHVVDRNDPPQSVQMLPARIPEDTKPGTLLGKLRVADEDSAEQHDLELAGGMTGFLELRDTLIYLSDESQLDHETQPRLTFSVRAEDSAGAQVVDTVQIRVTDVNEPPRIDSFGRLVMDEDETRNYYLRAVDPETDSRELQVDVSSTDPRLIPAENIESINLGRLRLLQIKPLPDSNGVAEIEVRVTDGTFSDSTRFGVEVRPVNDAPRLVRNIERRLDEGARLLIRDRTLRVRDVDDDPMDLEYQVKRAPRHGKILKGEQAMDDNGFDHMDVLRERIWYSHNGSEHHRDSVQFVVRDDQGARTSVITLPFDIVPINDPPSISSVEDQYILEDHATDPVSITIDDAETAAINLSVEGYSSDTSLVPHHNIEIGGVDRYRSVKVSPRPDANGEARITLAVNDGKDTTETSFKLTAAPVNDAPAVEMPDTIKSKEDVTAGPYSVRIFDQETNTGQLKVNIISTNDRLITGDGIHLKGGGPDKQLLLTPDDNQYGTTEIIIVASDGELADTARTYFRVAPVNDPPQQFSLYNSNFEQTFDSVRVTFNWGQAHDVEGDDVKYVFHLEGADLDTTIKDIQNTSYKFRTVNALDSNEEYQWLVYATDGKDTTRSKTTKQFLTPNLQKAPKEYHLYSNYPNPFNPVTRIKYKIPVRSNVRVSVYDMSGRMITQLVNKVQTPGEYQVSWNAGDRASGIYVCRIMATSLQGDKHFVQTKKMMLVK